MASDEVEVEASGAFYNTAPFFGADNLTEPLGHDIVIVVGEPDIDDYDDDELLAQNPIQGLPLALVSTTA